jgi:hypothetical protein
LRYPEIPFNFTTQTTISTSLPPFKRETYLVDAFWNRPRLLASGKDDVCCCLRDEFQRIRKSQNSYDNADSAFGLSVFSHN